MVVVSPPPPREASSASQSGRRELGCGPPCASYGSLVTMVAWRELLDEITECDSQDALAEFVRDFKKPKQALQDLANTAKTVTTRLTKALKEEEAKMGKKRVSEAQSAASAVAAARAAASAAAEAGPEGPGLVELALEAADSQRVTGVARMTVVQSTVIACSDAQLDWNRPFVLTDCSVSASLEGTKLHQLLEYNKKAFFADAKVDLAKGGAGRGAQQPKNSAIKDEIRQTFVRCLYSRASDLVSYEDLEASIASMEDSSSDEKAAGSALIAFMGGWIFGMAKATMHFGAEKMHFPSLRYAITGSRTVIAVALSTLEDFMKADMGMVPAGPEGHFTGAQMQSFFEQGTQAQFRAMFLKCQSWVHTVGPCEVFYAPAGFFTVESVLAGDDVFGVKIFALPRVAVTTETLALAATIAPQGRDVDMIRLACKVLRQAAAAAIAPSAAVADRSDHAHA